MSLNQLDMTYKTLLMLTELADWECRETEISGRVKLVEALNVFNKLYTHIYNGIYKALGIPKDKS